MLLRESGPALQPIDAGRTDRFEWFLDGTARSQLLLLTPAAPVTQSQFELPPGFASGRVRAIDLGRGAPLDAEVEAGRLKLFHAARIEAPIVLRIDR